MKQLSQKLKSGNMQVLEVPIPALGLGMVLVRNYYSLISPGTESDTVKAARKGYIGKARERPQQVKQVLDVLKSQGPAQTYRTVMKKLDAHSPLGYSCVGEVVDVGSDVAGFKVGDLVACGGVTASHAEVVAVPGNLCVSADCADYADCADDRDYYLKMAAYNTLGAIALQGVRQADLRLGETCAVIGLGLIGQLACLMLRASGVRVVGIDVNPDMAKIAGDHCTDLVLTRDTAGIEEQILEFTGGIGCDAVIITAGTDSLDPINFAGAIARKRGTVIVVGDVPTGFDRDPHYYRKELSVRMSCSYGPGRYDPEYEDKGRDYPVGYVRWTEKRNMEAFQGLIAEGKIDISYLTTHVFKLEDAPKAYNLILEKKEPYLGILIKYDPQITQITQKEKEDVSRKGAKALRDEDTYPSRIRSAVTGEFHGAGITQTKIIVKPSAISHQPSAISIGFIGAGSYAQSYLLPNIPKGKDVVLKGVMTSTSASSRSVADRYGFEFCTGNEADIWGDDGVNTVFIATRHDSHGHYVKRALEAGKHVFVEKPLCLNLEELVEIQAAHGSWLMAHGKKDEVQESQSAYQLPITNNESQITSNGPPLLMVGYNRRFSPLSVILKGKMGQEGPFSILYRVNAGAIPPDSWIQDKEIGGGRIIGEVCHFVDYMIFLSGSLPKFVQAIAMEDPNGHQDTLTVSLQFQDGSIGSIQYFANGAKGLPKEYIEVYAHGVTAVLKDFKALEIHAKKGRPFRKKLMRQNKGQKEMVRAFVGAVRDGGATPIPLEDLYAVTLTTFRILESLLTRKVVDLNLNSTAAV